MLLCCARFACDPDWRLGLLWLRIAMAITQIQTHRRNRHGSWRDGEGGAFDFPRPSILDWREAPTQRRQRGAEKASISRLEAAGLRIAALEDGSLSTPALAAGSQRRRSCLACRQRTPSHRRPHAARNKGQVMVKLRMRPRDAQGQASGAVK